MSLDGMPERINDIKDRADVKAEVYEAGIAAFAATIREFSLPIQMAFKVPIVLEEAIVNYQNKRGPESTEELHAVIMMAASNIFRMWEVSTPEIMEYFERQLDNHFPLGLL